jgi:hypothetical protein
MAEEKILTPLNSHSAATIFKSITIARPNPREELSATDLENHLAQAIWKCFDRLRSDASARLQVNETDLILADARVMGIKVDGHEVINPEGFIGREIELSLLLTLVRRDRIPAVGAHAFEEGSVRAHASAATNNLRELIYVVSGNDITTVFRVSPAETGYLTEFVWGKNDLIKAVAAEFGADEETANGLYLKYAGGGASAHVAKKFDEIFHRVFGTFINGLTMAVRGSVAPHLTEAGKKHGSYSEKSNRLRAQTRLPAIYLQSFILPAFAWSRHFHLGDRNIKLIMAPEVGIDRFLGDESAGPYGELNRLAKRRIRWLMPNDEV